MILMFVTRFVPRTSEAAHLYLMKGSGCSSTVGRTGSRQTVSLGTGCVYTGQSERSGRSKFLVLIGQYVDNIYLVSGPDICQCLKI